MHCKDCSRRWSGRNLHGGTENSYACFKLLVLLQTEVVQGKIQGYIYHACECDSESCYLKSIFIYLVFYQWASKSFHGFSGAWWSTECTCRWSNTVGELLLIIIDINTISSTFVFLWKLCIFILCQIEHLMNYIQNPLIWQPLRHFEELLEELVAISVSCCLKFMILGRVVFSLNKLTELVLISVRPRI